MPRKSSNSKVADGRDGDVTDSRFTSMYSAPIFKKYRKEDNKVKLDNRFGSVLTDKRFRSAPGAVDKYGRKTKKATAKAAKEELKQFYSIEGDDEKNGEGKQEELDESDSKVKTKVETRLDYLNKLSRGEIGSSSDSDSSSASGGDSDEDSEDDSNESKSDTEEAMPEEEVLSGDEDAPTGEATARLAIQSIDWDNMTAEDIMVVMQSFCPTGRTILKVTVYPSDFGKEQMEHEAKFGPAFLSKQGLKGRHHDWNEEDEGDDDDGNDNSSDEEDEIYDGVVGEEEEEEVSDDDEPDKKGKGRGGGKSKGGKMKGADFRRKGNVVGLVMQEELVRRGKADKSTLDDDMDNPQAASSRAPSSQEGGGVNSVALRRYELNKLKYFFAVAECDSVETANLVYRELDGMELENTSMVFDLRFVPDEISFAGRDVRDSTTSTTIAPSYKPPDFIVQALQHTSVECTWDEGDRERGRKLGQGFAKWKELNESELQQYLASDSDSDSDSQGETATKDTDGDGSGGQKNKGAKGSAKSKRKQARKLLLGDDSEDDDEDDDDDFFLNDSDDDANNGDGGKEHADDDDVDDVHQELSFVPSSDGRSNQSYEAPPADETPFERTMRRLAEKKKAKKVASKAKKAGMTVEAYLQGKLTEDPSEFDMYVDGEGDGKGKSSGKSKGRTTTEVTVNASAASKEELGLMFGKEEEEDFDMRSLVRAQKEKEREKEGKGKKKKKRGKKRDEESSDVGANERGKEADRGTDFSIDVRDNRFAQMMEGDSRFGIDPLAPEFKDTEAMRAIMGEQKKRRKKGEKKRRKEDEEGEQGQGQASTSVDISALKDRLKRRRGSE